MTTWNFTAAEPVTADLKLASGSVHVDTTSDGTVTVSLAPEHGASERGAAKMIDSAEVSFDAGTLIVHVPHRLHLRGDAALTLAVGLPEGSTVQAATASADVVCAGDLGSLGAETSSGDVTGDRFGGDADVRTVSGDVRLAEVGGSTQVETASGDIAVGRGDGEILVKTASGDVRIGQGGPAVEVKTASGDVRADALASGETTVATVSGDISLAVVTGIGVYLDISTLSGHVRSELDVDGGASPAGGDPDLAVSCRSVSGDVRLTRVLDR